MASLFSSAIFHSTFFFFCVIFRLIGVKKSLSERRCSENDYKITKQTRLTIQLGIIGTFYTRK